MSLGEIPPWTASGVLPPVNASQPMEVDRSPYVASLSDYVQRFGITSERRIILEGLMRYRAALHAVGVDTGFQWLNGSFVEDVELIEGRPPNDIDVVTFFRIHAGISQEEIMSKAGTLFDHESVKLNYHIDGYFVDLGIEPELLIERSAYWYSAWSHRRDQLWKGFVQVDLAPHEDDATAIMLALLSHLGRP